MPKGPFWISVFKTVLVYNWIVFEYGFVTAIKYVDVCVCVYKYGCNTASAHT